MNEQIPEDIRLLLMRAHLMRERREFALAMALCSEVLRREPANPEAHSIMGDIARDQGQHKEAIEWYKLALDIAPDNASDRKKMEEAIETEYNSQPVSAFDRIRGDLAGQIGGATAEMKAAAIPFAVYLALGAMICVIILVTVTALMLGRRGTMPAPQEAETAAGGFTAEVGTTPTGPPDQEQGLPVARFPEGISTLEGNLLNQLRQQARLLDPKCEVLNVELDPLLGTALLRIVMPEVWSPEDTREGILRVAGPLAQTAAGLDARITGVRLRCDTRGNAASECAFVGSLTGASLSQQGANGPGPNPAAPFATTWWRQDLAPPPTPQAAEGSSP